MQHYTTKPSRCTNLLGTASNRNSRLLFFAHSRSRFRLTLFFQIFHQLIFHVTNVFDSRVIIHSSENSHSLLSLQRNRFSNSFNLFLLQQLPFNSTRNFIFISYISNPEGRAPERSNLFIGFGIRERRVVQRNTFGQEGVVERKVFLSDGDFNPWEKGRAGKETWEIRIGKNSWRRKFWKGQVGKGH